MASNSHIESMQTVQFPLTQLNFGVNLLLFLTIAVSAYFTITIDQFVTTFLVMPSAVLALSDFSKRGGTRIDIGWRIEAAVSSLFTLVPLFSWPMIGGFTTTALPCSAASSSCVC